MKTVSILNLKGGVAKSFTAANMAYELWRRGYKVLLLDNDKQGDLSKAYGRYEPEIVSPAARLLTGDWQEPGELVRPTDYGGMDILTSNMSLFPAAWGLAQGGQGNFMGQYKKFMGTGDRGRRPCRAGQVRLLRHRQPAGHRGQRGRRTGGYR